MSHDPADLDSRKPFPIPVVALGPGSQPEDEGFDYLRMPQDMNTFLMPSLPGAVDPAIRRAAAEVIARLLEQMRLYRFGDAVYPRLELAHLEPAVVRQINELLGQGEVSAIAHVPTALRVQESAFAAVWRVHHPRPDGSLAHDYIEACAIPAAVREGALALAVPRVEVPPPPPGAMNAPALVHEILDLVARFKTGDAAHVINLTLLPVTPADLDYLAQTIGAGTTAILSRGYGNCRISSTGLANVWWVQYFNSMEQLILNTIEVVDVPEVALAAAEDFAASIERLDELLGTMTED
ncbi:MAG: hydrogenase expression/formation C-terminal domain-containing protein [Pseudomonadota bacterium]